MSVHLTRTNDWEWELPTPEGMTDQEAKTYYQGLSAQSLQAILDNDATIVVENTNQRFFIVE